jgi:hypothetical protein
MPPRIGSDGASPSHFVDQNTPSSVVCAGWVDRGKKTRPMQSFARTSAAGLFYFCIFVAADVAGETGGAVLA